MIRKKLMTLGVIAPMFAITVSCNRGPTKITFDEAFNFAIKNYDPYFYTGYQPTYVLKVNDFSIKDTKVYTKVVKDDSYTYEQIYYIDTSIKDLATTIDSDEIPLIHINSELLTRIAGFASAANALLGYFETYFTLEDNKYLGIYLGSEELHQVINIAGGVLAIMGIIDMFSSSVPSNASQGGDSELLSSLFTLLTAEDAIITATASCNNLGLLDRAHLLLEINDLSCALNTSVSEYINVITSKTIRLDVDFIVDYSAKK